MALAVKTPSANAEDTRDAGLIPGSRRSPVVGNGNPLQYSYWENSIGKFPTCRIAIHMIHKRLVSRMPHKENGQRSLKRNNRAENLKGNTHMGDAAPS